MFWDPKKAMQTIMTRRRGEGGGAITAETPMKPENVSDESGEPDGKHMAATEMIEAFHSKSADGLNKALQNYLDLHLAQPEKPYPPET